jgi:hypothetical protein
MAASRPGRTTRAPLLALVSALVTGCRGPSPSGALHAEGGSGSDGTVVDAVVRDDDASDGEGLPDSGDDGGSDGAAEVARCGSSIDGGQDGSTNVICSTEACLDSNWAQWPMPNGPADVANGAPNLEKYTANGDGTVTDDLTGLTWQEMPPTTGYTWADAETYCTTLTLATHSDWRVPTFIELVSILDYSQNAPTINLTVFPGAWVDFWSSTPFAGAPTDAREVYFSSGDTGHDGVFGTNYVRCARGPATTLPPAVPPARYTIVGGTVHDNKTGLTWQETVSSQTFAWADAKAYCANLNQSVAGGWRLPTAKELLTLVDVARSSTPTIDCDAFPDAAADDEWSATPFAGFSGSSPSAWAVRFNAGNPISRAVSSLSFVRCVR